MAPYVSGPNNTKYLVPSKIFINASILSNQIRKCFVPMKVLHEMLKPQYCHILLYLTKHYQNEKLGI